MLMTFWKAEKGSSQCCSELHPKSIALSHSLQVLRQCWGSLTHSTHFSMMTQSGNKVLDQELIKLLEGTPVQLQAPKAKVFTTKKCSRNISEMFSENLKLTNDNPPAPKIHQNVGRGYFQPNTKVNCSKRLVSKDYPQSVKENVPVHRYPLDYAEFNNNMVDACLTSNPYQNIQVFENSNPGRKFSYNNETAFQASRPG